jgi:hypothetical protein
MAEPEEELLVAKEAEPDSYRIFERMMPVTVLFLGLTVFLGMVVGATAGHDRWIAVGVFSCFGIFAAIVGIVSQISMLYVFLDMARNVRTMRMDMCECREVLERADKKWKP